MSTKLDSTKAETEPSYMQSLFVAFHDQIFYVLGLAHVIGAFLLVRAIWDEPIGYYYALAAMIAVPIAYLELQLFMRVMKWDDEPIIDLKLRATWMVAAGYALALALAGFLAYQEYQGRESQRRHEQQAAQEKAEMERLMKSPQMKAGMEYIRAQQAKKESQQK